MPKLNSAQLLNLSYFLDRISEATTDLGVQLAPYGTEYIEIGDQALGLVWLADEGRYAIEERS